MGVDQETKKATARSLIEAHGTATRSGDWTTFVDRIYSEACIYSCHYAGVMEVVARGREQIKETHYGRDMAVGWEGWEFPYLGVFLGDGDNLITHWLNRGPGKRDDGSYFECPGVSFITIDSSGLIKVQVDMFDLAHQMKLCDELESKGLLSLKLKENWVLPMKTKLISQLGGIG